MSTCLMKSRLSSGLPFEMSHLKVCELLFIVFNILLYFTQISQLPPPFRGVGTELINAARTYSLEEYSGPRDE